jgi:hypothetical protein
MTAVNPVASYNAAAIDPGAAQAMTQPGMPAGSEQKLIDYIARFQAHGVQTGNALSNPSALGGEALKALKGYFERASSLQDAFTRKAHAMSNDENGTSASHDGNQLPALQGGRESERSGAAAPNGERIEKVAGVSDADLDRAVEALMQVMSYSMETSMITTASNNVSKSASTLIRGQ